MKAMLLTLLIVLSISCNSQETKTKIIEIENLTQQKETSQIGQYVVETFQDSKGTFG